MVRAQTANLEVDAAEPKLSLEMRTWIDVVERNVFHGLPGLARADQWVLQCYVGRKHAYYLLLVRQRQHVEEIEHFSRGEGICRHGQERVVELVEGQHIITVVVEPREYGPEMRCQTQNG